MSTEWSAASLRQQQEHQAILRTLEAQRIAQTLVVPTLPHEVREALRGLGQPVRLFGENLANIRDRLRLELALRQINQAEQVAKETSTVLPPTTKLDDDDAVTKYTRASAALIEARNAMVQFSLERARNRLARERSLRTLAKKRSIHSLDEKWDSKSASPNEHPDELIHLDEAAVKVTKQLRNLALEGSQYCDHRALSSVRVVPINGSPLIVASSWTASLHLMNQGLQIVGSKTHCHEDRIMGLDSTTIQSDEVLVATCSLDKTAKIFKVCSGGNHDDDLELVTSDKNADRDESVGDEQDVVHALKVNEMCQLRGHAARLCRVAFHPMNKHVATTSFDHTWRLWDVATAECLLLQDGHSMECYGIGFHHDGSLVSTTDLGGIVHLWDLRVGKSISWYRSHAGKVLNTDFHPNGFQMATAGHDGCIHVWDLRRRVKNQRTVNPQQSSTPLVSIPAHNSIVTKLRFAPSGEYLISSSFDGLVKLWSCRTWKSLNHLRGHESKVTCVDVIGDAGIVSTGFDKTVKLWL